MKNTLRNAGVVDWSGCDESVTKGYSKPARCHKHLINLLWMSLNSSRFDSYNENITEFLGNLREF